MIEKLLNQMRMQTLLTISNLAFTKTGVIQNYDPVNYAVKVIINPQDVETPNNTLTGWIPLLSPWVGNNWGMFAAPALGSSCAVYFSDASYAAPFAAMCFYNNSFRPVETQAEEFYIIHSSGSALKFTNDGNVLLMGNNTINIDAQNVNIGNLTAGNLMKLLNESAANVFNTHTHGAGPGPDQTMGASDMTAYTEAN